MRQIKTSSKLVVSLLISAVLVITSPVTSSAVGFSMPPPISNKAKAHLDVWATGSGSCASPEVTATAATNTGNNPRTAFQFFVSKGFSEKQAAGIIGNFVVESGVDPKRVQGSGHQTATSIPKPYGTKGYGLAQWTSAGRQQELEKRAKPVHDLMQQLNFVIWELQNTEKAAYDAFKGTTSIRDATNVWKDRYERPGVDATAERLAAANKAYGDFSGGQNATPNPDPLSLDDAINVGADIASGAVDDAVADMTECSSATAGEGSGDIVAIAKAELAKKVVEQPIGCDAGNPSVKGNCGKEVNKYTDSTLEYWCADFVSWVYKTAGKPFTGGSSGGWRIPSAEGVQAYMEKNGKFYENKASSPDPQPGDIYIINDGSHVGIVVKVENGNMYTISGNTSTDNYRNGVGVGDAVYENYKSNSSISGWGGLR